MQAFVYGTLTDPDRVARVVDDVAFLGDAVLAGMHRVDGEYPTLAPGGTVEGRVLETDDDAALDAYEGVDRGLYVRVPVPVAADAPFGTTDHTGDRTVDVYVGRPDRLGAAAADGWPASESGLDAFSGRVRAAAAECVVRHRD